MRRQAGWLIFGCVMVLFPLLASCARPVTPTPITPTPITPTPITPTPITPTPVTPTPITPTPVTPTPVTPTPVEPTLKPPAPSPSPYEGTYIGMFTYEYKDNTDKTVSDGFRVTLTLRYTGVVPGGFAHDVTSVSVSDPYFGAQSSIMLTPGAGGAWLPATPPTTPSNRSQQEQGIEINFPNGTSLATNFRQGDTLQVGIDGKLLSNSLDPGIQGETWFAWGIVGGAPRPFQERFVPPQQWQSFKAKSWSLTKSAL